jgi:DNA-binding NarL/FixJ family response regulator
MPRPTAETARRALVVDADDGVRALVVDLLTRDGFEILEAATGERALELVGREPPQLAVLEVEIPGMSGYEVCGELRRRFEDQLAIIFLSGSRTESFDRVAGFKFGADDYVIKPFDPEELIARVHAVVRRTTASNRNAAAERSLLTPRELEVLVLLGRGKPPAAIASDLFITPSTVSKHVERILKKLRVHSMTEAVSFGFREGLFDE